MEIAVDKPEKLKRGQTLTDAKKLIYIGKIIDYLTQGYYSTNQLAEMTGLSRRTIDKYRPLADELISKQTLNRNNIRNLQIKRTYEIIERLMKDLSTCETIKEKTLIYNQIAKFSQHLALITGLNVETHVNVDHQQLVIIRSNGKKTKNEVIDQEAEIVPELINISTAQPVNSKQGHSIET